MERADAPRALELVEQPPEDLLVVAGRCVVVRPYSENDLAALTRFYEGMDHESRYRRFLQPMPRIPHGLLDTITAPSNQLTLAIDLGDAERGVVLAEVVVSTSRSDPTRGEVAYSVDPSVRRNGLATRSLAHALERAYRSGVRHVDAYISGENRASVALMRSFGATTRFDDGLVLAELELAGPAESETRPVPVEITLPCLDHVPAAA